MSFVLDAPPRPPMIAVQSWAIRAAICTPTVGLLPRVESSSRMGTGLEENDALLADRDLVGGHVGERAGSTSIACMIADTPPATRTVAAPAAIQTRACHVSPGSEKVSPVSYSER